MTESKKLVVDISLIGEVEKRALVTRCGAREGDVILVTGLVGGSIKRKHLNFTPRIKEARYLVKNFKISSMIDVTDGLILDLSRILGTSRVGARIHQGLIPVSGDAASFKRAITDGEDFELLFTMGRQEAKRLLKTGFQKMNTPVVMIGEILPKAKGYKLVCNDGKIKKLKSEGYVHFK